MIILAFVLGMMCGGTLGVLLMACVIAGARADAHPFRPLDDLNIDALTRPMRDE